MFKTNEVLLNSLLDDVESAKIQLPDFQRGWIWDDVRIRGLIASISKGFPVGAVMTLSTGGDIKLKSRPIEGVNVNGTKSGASFYLLDGQQRLTTLFQALRHPQAVDTSDSRRQKTKRWYYIDMRMAMDPNADREDAVISVPESKMITTDFGRKVVTDLSDPTKEFQNHMIPTESLMNPTIWMLAYLGFWEKSAEPHPEGNAVEFFTAFQKEVQSNFNAYQLPVINLEASTPKEAVCTVFEKVNTGGVPLNVFELATASFAADAEDFSLRDDWRERRHRLYSFSGVLQAIQGDQFLQAVALLKTQEAHNLSVQKGVTGRLAPAIGCKKKDILGLSLEEYLRWANEVEEGFKAAAKFLAEQYVLGRNNVPYNTQLVPLAALFVELGPALETAIAKQRLARWYWSGVFGEIYGGTTETQFALDLVEVAAFVRGGPQPRLVNEANFVPERLVSLRTRQSAAYKGVYALQLKHGAADWRSGMPLTLAAYFDDSIDIHHIFPLAWCENESRKVPSALYNSIINKTPIDATTNRIIGGGAPSHYLNRLRNDIDNETLTTVLTAHWLDVSHLEEDDFAKSFVARGEAMLKLIGREMGRDLDNGRDALIDALKAGGYPGLYIEDENEVGEMPEAEALAVT